MEPRDTLNLVERVAHLCPAMRIETGTAEAWHAVIGHLDGEDALAAVRLIAARKPFIAPSDIIETVADLRRRRLDAANLVFEPRSGESAEQANARLRQERQRAAAGITAPRRPELAAPARPVQVPASIGRIVAEARAAREHPALKIPCPWAPCKAGPGNWCDRPRPGSDARRAKAGFLHPSRCEAAGVDYTPETPQDTEAAR